MDDLQRYLHWVPTAVGGVHDIGCDVHIVYISVSKGLTESFPEVIRVERDGLLRVIKDLDQAEVQL